MKCDRAGLSGIAFDGEFSAKNYKRKIICGKNKNASNNKDQEKEYDGCNGSLDNNNRHLYFAKHSSSNEIEKP